MKSTMRILASSLLIALSPLAAAQVTGGGDLDTQVRVLDATAANKGQTLVAGKIASNFTNLAGSEENALALVNALRTGGEAKIVTTTTVPGTGGAPATTTTTNTAIDTPTGKMGWGNVKIALGLAQDVLLRAGITDPTAAQLQTALNGGTLTRADGTTFQTKGVLQLRADGMGWGKIAQAGGTKVGPVVSTLRETNARLAALPPAEKPATTTTTATTAAAGATAAGKSTAKGVNTAAGGAATASGGKGSKGVTTAAGGSTTVSSGDKSPKGITTAGGATAGNGHASKGLVTAGGASAGAAPKGNAYGRGVVTAAGGTSTQVAAASSLKGGNAAGAGVVSGSGGAAGVTHGGGNGNGNAGGNGNGKGKGG